MKPDALKKEIPLGSYALSLDSVRKIFAGLNEIVDEQKSIELAALQRQPDVTEEKFEAYKSFAAENAFKVTVNVVRADGSETIGNTIDVFDQAPNEAAISTVYMSNKPAYQLVANTEPTEYFQLLLDFSQQPILDAGTFVSSPTQNDSSLTIGGRRDGWIAGVERVITKHIDRRFPIRRFFHGAFVYDIGLLVVGAPFAFYICWLFTAAVQSVFNEPSGVLVVAAYVYLFFAGVWAYRLLFSYARWAFPVAELTDQKTRPRRHRLAWWSIISAIGLKIFWDLVGPLLSIRGWFG